MEEEGGSVLMLDEVMNLENARVIDLFQDLEFAMCGATDEFSVEFRSVSRDVVDSDPAFRGFDP